MNVLSLFDGISCGMIALERAGIKVSKYFASEIDSSPEEISKKNYPNIIRLGDVNNWEEWDLPKIDLIIGGSPCQGFSRNGKGLNFEDPRSALFFKYVDILNMLRKKNPDIKFLLENVKMQKEWESLISEYLGVKAIEINSKLVSAQNRQRLYWTNIKFDIPDDRHINLLDILEDDPDVVYEKHNGIYFDKTINTSCRNLCYVDGEGLKVKQAVKKGYILANDGDGINLTIPTSKTRRGRVIKSKSSTLDCACDVCVYHDGKIRKFTRLEKERLQTLPDYYTDGFSERLASHAIGNGWTVDVIASIFSGLKGEQNE